MSRIVQLTQGSPEWLDYRRSRRNASETAAVMGLSPWSTPYQLWLEKTSRTNAKVTQAMQRGTELEPSARSAYEEQTELVMQPLVIEDGAYSASLDGMTLAGDLVLEIKCPMRGTRSDLWQDVSQGQVPEHYRVQVQHQLMVSGAEQAHLWVFDGAKGILTELTRDEALMARIREAWEAFQQYLTTDTAPPLTEADTAQRTDAAWTLAAAVYVQAKQRSDSMTEQLEAAKQGLLALLTHPREQGAGVTVTRYWKQGNVDYKKVPQLQGQDLTAYRSQSRQEIRVTIG